MVNSSASGRKIENLVDDLNVGDRIEITLTAKAAWRRGIFSNRIVQGKKLDILAGKDYVSGYVSDVDTVRGEVVVRPYAEEDVSSNRLPYGKATRIQWDAMVRWSLLENREALPKYD